MDGKAIVSRTNRPDGDPEFMDKCCAKDEWSRVAISLLSAEMRNLRMCHG